MDSINEPSSEASSDENESNDPPEKLNGGTREAAVRSYECTFCKGGFSNAQALGGHMNMHRKDKAKSNKLISGPSVVSPKSGENSIVSVEPGPCYSAFGAQMYFPFSNPSFPRANQPDFSGRPRGDYTGGNLGLRIGSPVAEGGGEKKKGGRRSGKGSEVLDLELRLGHNPQ
ncbi:hypothetical protein U1Q18_015591 [Sarracenia purpurea var. burkii]